MKRAIIISAICVSALAVSGQDVIWKMTYDIAFPFSKTKEYADQVSWRGVSFDVDRLFNDQMAVGVGVAWSVFLEKEPDSYFEYNDMTIHGTQVRYINNIPILARFSWYQSAGDFDTYFTAGVGTVWQENTRNLGLWSFQDNYWQFALSPEAGIIYPVGRAFLTVKVKYMQGFKTADAPSLSYLGIGIGFAW
jgi:hypothetical protein